MPEKNGSTNEAKQNSSTSLSTQFHRMKNVHEKKIGLPTKQNKNLLLYHQSNFPGEKAFCHQDPN